MRLRFTALTIASFLVAACTSGREDVPDTGASSVTGAGVGTGTGGGGGATGTGGTDNPLSSVGSTGGSGTGTPSSSSTDGTGGTGGTGSSSSTSDGTGGTGVTVGSGGAGQGGAGGQGGAEATCVDLTMNGDETDIDCGGTCPLACADDLGCLVADDCISKVCGDDFTCTAPSCTDGIQNGSESDVDCGGTTCEKCGAGKTCGAAVDCASGLCPAGTCLCPAAMTTIPVPGGGSYCMDPTEVTYLEYDAFLTSNPQSDIPGCAFNDFGYTPTALWPPEPIDTNAPNYIYKPVRYVDWCDAAAYCERAGKRLCGAIGGGPSSIATLDETQADQWYNACTAGGANVYPYGDEFNTARCTESVDDASTGPVNVRQPNGNLTGHCLGGFSGVYELSGNNAEWEDICDGATGASDSCVVRGGSFLTEDSADVTCSSYEEVTRATAREDIGFRCCQ